MLKYGTGNPRNKKSVKQKDPKARIEELKRMYRAAAVPPDKSNEGTLYICIQLSSICTCTCSNVVLPQSLIW